MKRLLATAAPLLASSAAHAGDSYSFEVGGRTIHIDAPSGCDSPSCISVSIPGVYELGPKRPKRARTTPQATPQAKVELQAPPGSGTEQSVDPVNGSSPEPPSTTATVTPSRSRPRHFAAGQRA